MNFRKVEAEIAKELFDWLADYARANFYRNVAELVEHILVDFHIMQEQKAQQRFRESVVEEICIALTDISAKKGVSIQQLLSRLFEV